MKDAYREITQKIVYAIEKGNRLPWRRTWRVADAGKSAHNLISNRKYQGINRLILGCTEFNDPRFATFNQVRSLGGRVLRGEKGTLIIFSGRTVIHDKDSQATYSRPLMRFFTVFNVEQCDIPGIHPIDSSVTLQDIDLQKGLDLIQMPNKPQVRHGGNRAYFSVLEDCVQMPHLERFESNSEYLSVLYHELAHATGHPSRLNRFEKSLFEAPNHAFEELIAELSCTFTGSELGISNNLDNHVAYIDSWLEKLRGDSRYIFKASRSALLATNYILNQMEQPCLL